MFLGLGGLVPPKEGTPSKGTLLTSEEQPASNTVGELELLVALRPAHRCRCHGSDKVGRVDRHGTVLHSRASGGPRGRQGKLALGCAWERDGRHCGVGCVKYLVLNAIDFLWKVVLRNESWGLMRKAGAFKVPFKYQSEHLV